MTRRLQILLVVAGAVALSAVTYSEAESVKSIILAEVDPGGTNGTVVKFFDELTPEEEAQYSSNFENGQGYFISPVATVSRTAGGVHYVERTKIMIVPLDGESVVVPLSVKCQHSGCKDACSASGCDPKQDEDGKSSCSGASCTGDGCGAQNPTCSKTSSLDRSSFLVFGSV